MGGTSTAVLWFPTRAMRARPFSGSSTGGAWPGRGALCCCRRKKRRRRRTEERREEEKRRAWLAGGTLRCCRREKRRRTEERKEEEKRDLVFFVFCCDFLVFSNKKFCLWFSLASIAEETKS
jgi:hypothetical protein